MMDFKYILNPNYVVASYLLSFLKEQEIKDIFIAPGSRSAPLALALSNSDYFNLHLHFDERALGFMALGYAKAQEKPAVIITTSGSAVGNLLPALMEANQTNIPIIVISADRPYELLNCGANQTCMQDGIFSDYALSLSIPCLDQYINLGVIHNRVIKSYEEMLLKRKPLHLNVHIREPLYTLVKEYELTKDDFKVIFNIASFESFKEILGYLSTLKNDEASSFLVKNFEGKFFSKYFDLLNDRKQNEESFNSLDNKSIQTNQNNLKDDKLQVNKNIKELKEESEEITQTKEENPLKNEQYQKTPDSQSSDFQKVTLPSLYSFSKGFAYFAKNNRVNGEGLEDFLLTKMILKPTIILVGDLTPSETISLSNIFKDIKNIVISDIQSSLRSFIKRGEEGTHFFISEYEILNINDYLVRNQEEYNLLVFGGRFISKKLLKLIQDFKGEVTFINSSLTNLNATNKNAQYITVNYVLLLIRFLDLKFNLKPSREILEFRREQLEKLQVFHEKIKSFYMEVNTFLNFSTLNYINVFKCLERFSYKGLFLGNSSIIRAADILLNPKSMVYSSRGVSGIDGQIATACAICEALENKNDDNANNKNEPLISIIGDTTALYDLSSISLLKNQNHILIIINNNGGAIFNKFPIENKETLNKFFINPTNVSFKNICEMFKVSYVNPINLKDYLSTLENYQVGPIVIELNVSQDSSLPLIETQIKSFKEVLKG
ncbi:MAG: thiamine pyrophosphate-binding protein [Succinivibrionaceae bacterium]|nr:thiamine pyrophosphate-binding protein [Succinivibrionaceae bacterium]